MLPGEARPRCTLTCAYRYAPVRSAYVWDGTAPLEGEHPLLLKARAELAEQVERAVRTLHPYEVPPIIRVKVDSAKADYIQWVHDVTRVP